MILRVLIIMGFLGMGFLRLAEVALPLLNQEARGFIVAIEVIAFTILMGITIGTHFSRRCVKCNARLNENEKDR